MFNFCFPFQMIFHLVFNGGNPEKSQLVCRIKVPHLLLHLIKCSQRLLAKGVLNYAKKKVLLTMPHILLCDKMFSRTFGKIGSQCCKKVLTMPRALSASSPTSAPYIIHNQPVIIASKYYADFFTVETPIRICIHLSIISIVSTSLCFCLALNFR